MQTIAYLLMGLLPFATSSCRTYTRSIDRSHMAGESLLWRRVDDRPLSYAPKGWPASSGLTKRNGEWLVDPQDDTRFYVPNKTFDNIPSAVWRAEALQCLNRFTKEEQDSNNARFLMVDLPVLAVLMTTLVAVYLACSAGMAAGGAAPDPLFKRQRGAEGMYVVNPNP